MNGPEGARGTVEAHLTAALPAVLADIEARLELAGDDLLPAPQLAPPVDTEKLTVDQFPALVVTVWDTEKTERTGWDVDDLDNLDGSNWRVTYRMRVFMFVRDADTDRTTTRRDRYALGLREAMLGRPSLGTGDAQVDETTWRESYSDVVASSARRTVAGVYAEFLLTVVETLTAPAAGVVEFPEVQVEDLPIATTVVR